MSTAPSGRWLSSSKRNPCPICGRSKDGSCSVRADGTLAACHYGTTHSPPKELRRSQVVDGMDRQQWAFTGDSSDGRTAMFTLDKPREGSIDKKVVPLRRRTTPAPPQPAPLPSGPVLLSRLPDGVELPDLSRERATYRYTPTQETRREPDGKGGKTIRPWHLQGNEWVCGAGSDPWPLFQQALALEADGWVLELEGERCAGIAMAGALVAISQPGSDHTPEAITARYAALVAAGVPGVVYISDHDQQGERKAKVCAAAAAAAGLPFIHLPASEVWPGIPAKGSIDDAPGTPAEAAAAIEKALEQHLQAAKAAPAPAESTVEVQKQAQGTLLPFTEAQRFELLRGRARQVLEEHHRKVEQELAMRMAAQELGLPSLGTAQVRALLWEARNGDAGSVQPLTPDQPLSLAPTPWLLEGIVMAGALNLIVALPKVGKTAFALGFIGAWVHGQHQIIGCNLPPTPCPPVLIVGTDQPENDWARMLAQFGLLDHSLRMNPKIIGLFTAGRPLHLDSEGIDRITIYAEQHHGLLVLIDSLHACISPLGLKEESAEVAEPVRDLMSALEPHGAAVLLIHHANKGRANDGAVAASRGSTALPAVASQTISLTRLQTGAGGQQGNKERRLIIKTEGRGGMPQELLIERTDAEGWICHGDAATAMEAQAREQAREKLTDRQRSVLGLLIERAKAGEVTTPNDVCTERGIVRNRALETLEALVQKGLAIKPTEVPTATGGRPPATYLPVPTASLEP